MKKVFISREFDKKRNQKHIIFLCDHASNFIPKSYNNLGLPSKVLNSHISWDIGAKDLCKKVSKNNENMGILVCGSGMGMSMAANKHKKIRAALGYSIRNTRLSRLHNNANIITLGSRLTKKDTAFKCISVFFNTNFEGGRHKKRVKKI